MGRIKEKFIPVQISQELCLRCERCLRACNPKAIYFENSIRLIDYSKCKACLNCVQVCPRNAVEVTSIEFEDQVLSIKIDHEKCSLCEKCLDEKENFCPKNLFYKSICNWALSEDVKAKEIVIFQGIPQRGIIDDYPVYYAAEEAMMEQLEKFGISKVEKGIIVGPEATVLNEALTNRLNAYALFTPVLEIPTPEGAASILEVLNKIYELSIDTASLIEQGKEIKAKMLELAQKAQQYQQQQQLPGTGKEYTQYFQ